MLVQVSVLRVLGWVLVIVALYAVITQPVASAATVRGWAGGLDSAARTTSGSLMQFTNALTR